MSIINLAGLTLTLLSFLLIDQYVEFESSYDKFITKANSIYRATIQVNNEGALTYNDAMNFEPAGQAMLDEFEEVTGYTRISPENANVVLRSGELFFNEARIYYADSAFFNLFDFTFIEGNPARALAHSGSIVLTKTLAERYFGRFLLRNEPIVGRSMQFNSNVTLTVTAVIEDVPVNSHLNFSALISIENFPDKYRHPTRKWGFNNFYTYVELQTDADYKLLEAKLPRMLDKYFDSNKGMKIRLQPLIDIHLLSHLDYEITANGDEDIIFFLQIISFLILIIGWANYANITSAKATDRINEVCIKKINGATNANLLMELLSESFLLNLTAFLLAILLASMITPFVGTWLNKPMELHTYIAQNAIRIMIFYLISSMASGFYPSLLLISIKPKMALYSSIRNTFYTRGTLRKILVVFQFAITICLITGTMVVYKQLSYMQSQKLGFESDRIVILKAPATIDNDTIFKTKFESFKNDVGSHPIIRGVALSSAIPGNATTDLDYYGGIRLLGDPPDKSNIFPTFKVDESFVKVYNLKVLAGEAFKEGVIRHDTSVVINESASRRLGFNDPNEAIGKTLRFMGRPTPVLGVIEDYHHKSLKSPMEPMILYNRMSQMDYLSIQFEIRSLTDYESLLKVLNQAWNKIYTFSPFEYFFLDEHYQQQYQTDAQFSILFLAFTMIAIIVACLGLIGLTAHLISRKLKELAIRKVLGAGHRDILYLVCQDYLVLLAIAFIISTPLSWYVLEWWLSNFAYRIELSWVSFLLSMLVVSLISMTVIFQQSIKALIMNPVQVLHQD